MWLRSLHPTRLHWHTHTRLHVHTHAQKWTTCPEIHHAQTYTYRSVCTYKWKISPLLYPRKVTFQAMVCVLTLGRLSGKHSTNLNAQKIPTLAPQLRWLLEMGLWCGCAQYPFCTTNIHWLPWNWAKSPPGSPTDQRLHWMPASNNPLVVIG